jgi:hypothetical protein
MDEDGDFASIVSFQSIHFFSISISLNAAANIHSSPLSHPGGSESAVAILVLSCGKF